MNTNGIVDILNALPTSKLISTVSAGIGKLYEPTHIKRIAKAKAEEIKLISGVMEECSVIPTQYNDGSLTLNNTDWDNFVRRTQGRMAFQELQKQNNIECVVAKAYNILENEQTCSDEPVEQGWINRFFDSVADVSDDDLQKLWGKVLAGEIKQPNSYSLRTLETLKNLSRYEAELFRKIAPYILKCYGNESKTFYDYFLLSGCVSMNHISQKMQVNFPMILDLSNAGLISSNSLISAGIDINSNVTETIYGISESIQIHNNGSDIVNIRASAFILSTAGKELLPVVLSTSDTHPYQTYMNDCWSIISQESTPATNLTIKFYTV